MSHDARVVDDTSRGLPPPHVQALCATLEVDALAQLLYSIHLRKLWLPIARLQTLDDDDEVGRWRQRARRAIRASDVDAQVEARVCAAQAIADVEQSLTGAPARSLADMTPTQRGIYLEAATKAIWAYHAAIDQSRVTDPRLRALAATRLEASADPAPTIRTPSAGVSAS
jgi:hypothetical protein